MSIHLSKSRDVASKKGAALGVISWNDFREVTSMSKRELAECALHLAAMCTDSYDDSMNNGAHGAVKRLLAERDALKANGLI